MNIAVDYHGGVGKLSYTLAVLFVVAYRKVGNER